MIFGKPDQFAIEAMVEPYLVAPSSVWGRMRVWCAGTPLGDYSSEHCGLPGAHFEELGHKVLTLWRGEFNGLSNDQIFDLLDFRLYGYVDGIEMPDDRTDVQVDQDAAAYGRFNFLNNWGEMFDQIGKAFILCPDGASTRVLYRPYGVAVCQAFEAPSTLVIDACSNFVEWHDANSVRLRSRG